MTLLKQFTTDFERWRVASLAYNRDANMRVGIGRAPDAKHRRLRDAHDRAWGRLEKTMRRINALKDEA